MGNNQIKINRVDLYKKVWSSPMRKLAKEFGMSDRGLSKLCKRHNIPVPGLGYWAKLEFNKPVKKTTLPNTDSNDEIVISVIEVEDEYVDQEHFSKAEATIRTIRNGSEQFRVCSSLTNLHQLVSDAYKILKKAKKNQNGILYPRTNQCLNIQVSPESLMRGLCVMDALIKTLENCDFKISLANEKVITYVDVLGVKIEVCLKEKCDRDEIELTPKQMKERERHPWMCNTPQYKYSPNGQLSLVMKTEEYISGIRRQWSDGKRRNLDDMISASIIGLIKMAIKIRSKEIEREEWRKKWEEERQKQLELEKKKQEEQQKIDQLEGFVKDWIHSQNIRSYLLALKEALLSKYGKIDEGSNADIWLKWANSYANRIDPLFADS